MITPLSYMRALLIPSILLALTTVGAAPRTLLAQSGYVFTGAEAGTDDLSSYVIGATLISRLNGWSPVASVLGYNVNYPVGGGSDAALWAVVPSVGLRYQGRLGSTQLSVGYGVRRGNTDAPNAPHAGAQRGAVTSLIGDLAPGSRSAVQGIVNYSWGERYVWTRVRATTAAAEWVRVGGEFVLQGGADALKDAGSYGAVQAGPLFDLALGERLRLAGGPGAKILQGATEPSNPEWYAKIEMVWIR